MKVLTLTQPWAQLVAIGAKRIETRSWNTKYRGPLAIHAAKGFPFEARNIAFRNQYFRTPLALAGFVLPDDLPRGVIVATCNLMKVEQIYPDTITPPMPEYELGSYDLYRYMWFLENIQILPEPIPAKGALGLWEFDGELSIPCSLGYDMNEVRDGKDQD